MVWLAKGRVLVVLLVGLLAGAVSARAEMMMERPRGERMMEHRERGGGRMMDVGTGVAIGVGIGRSLRDQRSQTPEAEERPRARKHKRERDRHRKKQARKPQVPTEPQIRELKPPRDTAKTPVEPDGPARVANPPVTPASVGSRNPSLTFSCLDCREILDRVQRHRANIERDFAILADLEKQIAELEKERDGFKRDLTRAPDAAYRTYYIKNIALDEEFIKTRLNQIASLRKLIEAEQRFLADQMAALANCIGTLCTRAPPGPVANPPQEPPGKTNLPSSPPAQPPGNPPAQPPDSPPAQPPGDPPGVTPPAGGETPKRAETPPPRDTLPRIPYEPATPLTRVLMGPGPDSIAGGDGLKPKPDASCGPDITDQVVDVLARMKQRFDNTRFGERFKACAYLFDPGKTQNAWDIRELGPRAPGFDDYEGCGVPRNICRDTVEIFGACYTYQIVNYVQYGLMHYLCGTPNFGDIAHVAWSGVNLALNPGSPPHAHQNDMIRVGSEVGQALTNNPASPDLSKVRDFMKYNAGSAPQCPRNCKLKVKAKFRYNWTGLTHKPQGASVLPLVSTGHTGYVE